MRITSIQIDHQGLEAEVFDRLGIGKVIDSQPPKSRHHKVTRFKCCQSQDPPWIGAREPEV
jgi:hypothetical protein